MALAGVTRGKDARAEQSPQKATRHRMREVDSASHSFLKSAQTWKAARFPAMDISLRELNLVLVPESGDRQLNAAALVAAIPGCRHLPLEGGNHVFTSMVAQAEIQFSSGRIVISDQSRERPMGSHFFEVLSALIDVLGDGELTSPWTFRSAGLNIIHASAPLDVPVVTLIQRLFPEGPEIGGLLDADPDARDLNVFFSEDSLRWEVQLRPQDGSPGGQVIEVRLNIHASDATEMPYTEHSALSELVEKGYDRIDRLLRHLEATDA